MRRLLVSTLACLATPALAEPPVVVADIAPVHALVAQVMGDLGEPTLLVPSGAPAHALPLRPSDAAKLQSADMVVWIGPSMTPWLAGPLETLAGEAVHLGLLAADGTHRLPLRDATLFAHEHEHGHDGGAKGDGHTNHTHDEDHDHADDPAATAADPHAWLDPDNAQLWLGLIAETLAIADPENAAIYRANAARGSTAVEAAAADARAMLADVDSSRLLAAHDAFQYFEEAFGLPLTGSVAASDAQAPGPARVATVREAAVTGALGCVLNDLPTPNRLLATVIEGTDARIVTADPLGGRLPAGAGLYPALLRELATIIADCG